MRAWIGFAALAAAGFGLDLATKHIATTRIPYQEEVVLIENYLAFGHIYNEGIVFGKWNEAKPLWLVVSVLAVPAIVAIFAAVKKPGWILTVSLGLILGGTLGNLYDRAAFGKVRDFIKFSYDAKHVWPLFNLADAYICVGVVLLSVEMVFFDEKKKAKRKEAEAAKAAAAAKAIEGEKPQAEPIAPTEPVPKPAPSEPEGGVGGAASHGSPDSSAGRGDGTPASTPLAREISCPQCSRYYPDDLTQCPQCGVSRVAPSGSDEPTVKPPPCQPG